MKRFLWLWLLVAFVACAPINPAPPLPPRPPALSFQTGIVVFLPVPLDELEHYRAWKPRMRVPVYSATTVQLAFDTFGDDWPFDLLVETVDDPLMQIIAAHGQHAKVRVEGGNELGFVQESSYVRAFYQRSLDVLHEHGWDNRHFVTGGVANIEPRTIAWTQESIQGLPSDVVVGWHAYSNWQAHRLEFVAAIGGRVCSMTEMGAFDQSTPALEQQAFDLYAAQLPLIEAMGCDVAIGYQNHDGGPGERFGFHALDGHWRISEQALKTAFH